VDVTADTGAPQPTYGVSASPLVVADTVVVAAGGPEGRALVGYAASSGERRWSGGDGPPAYGSPVHAVLAGAAQIVVLNGAAVAAHDPRTGSVLWEFAWPAETEKAFSPLPLPGDRLFVSTGYGVGGKLLEVRADGQGALAVHLVWESSSLKAKFASAVHRAGSLYGLDDGILACIDAASGERRWKGGRYGHGQLLLSDDLLVVSAEDGRVALVAADPGTFVELGVFTALHGKTWNHPALAGSHLIVRNDREAACFELPQAQEQEIR
jgi:outer membrane protein assembly factor BamB